MADNSSQVDMTSKSVEERRSNLKECLTLVANQLAFGWTSMIVYEGLRDYAQGKDYRGASVYFFISSLSCANNSILTLTRMFDRDDRSLSLRKLFAIAHTQRDIAKHKEDVSVLFSDWITHRKDLGKRVQKSKTFLYRNKMLAHFDHEYIETLGVKRALAETFSDLPETIVEAKELYKICREYINRMSGVFFGFTTTDEVLGAHDFEYMLDAFEIGRIVLRNQHFLRTNQDAMLVKELREALGPRV